MTYPTLPQALMRPGRILRVSLHAMAAALLSLVVGTSSLGAQAAARSAAASSADRWWQEGVVYQVYPRSFQDSDGNGVGDLRGITQRLDYLKTLGINAIWISPFFPSPMKDFGYDVANYTGVDTTFGTLADFDSLARAAHARGMRVILDFVTNHTSDQHPWFVESRSSRTNAKRDWYVWHDAARGGGPPNNWLSVFGGSGWTLDSTTGQYYLHQFLAAQPDLNWRSAGLRKAMYDAMRFWLDRGADGFRLDAFPFMVEDARFRDNPPDTAWRGPGREYDKLVALHTTHQPETFDILCEMRRIANGYAERDGQARLLIAEIYTNPKRLATYFGRNGCGAQLPSNFGLLGAPWKADVVHARIDEYMRALPAGRWPNWAIGNHDNSRLATRLGPDAARAAAVLLLTLPGTPTIYYGDELGMRDVPIPPDLVQDPAEKQQPGLGLGRDPERTPMQWSAEPNGGFTTGRPWLPVAQDVGRVNVATARGDSSSTLALYERLLALRKAAPAISRGTFRMLPRQGDVLGYVRQDATRGRYLVLVNVGQSPATFALSPATVRQLTDNGSRVGRVIAGTATRTGDDNVLRSMPLSGNEAVVIELAARRTSAAIGADGVESLTHGQWIDATATLDPATTPVYEGDAPMKFDFLHDLRNGDGFTLSVYSLGAHSGTHIDAPMHFVRDGAPIDRVPLDPLIGPARIIDIADGVQAIDAAELDRHQWRGAQRVLFRTRSSLRGWMHSATFHRDFAYIAPDAAQLLADAGVKLVGIDYISAEQFGAPAPMTHRILLGRGIPIVEGLSLEDVGAGDYDLIVLPMKVAGHEGAPARAVLRKRGS